MPARLEPIHPGKILAAEFMEPLGLSQSRLARDLDVPVARVHDILKGRRGITADTALRLATYFATTPDLWMNLQARYDLKRAQRAAGKSIRERVRPLKAA
ncbi:MAG: HigA family addiction module antidote protein [Rhodospirillaceae bacterium]|nr:HigA family addiction module antidote protein [Rhodospirillaceae bacterium]